MKAVAQTAVLKNQASQQSKVIKNTYALLALSMIPTVFGSIVGANMDWSFAATNPMLTSIGFLVVSIAIFAAIDKTKDSGTGVALLLAFTGLMGAMLGPLLNAALSTKTGHMWVAISFGTTAAIFAGMSILANVLPAKATQNWGSYLLWGTISLIAISLLSLFIDAPALSMTISAMAILIFSAYIVYDLQRIVRGGETNYVMATLNLYLSIYNIFSNTLRLLMSFGADE